MKKLSLGSELSKNEQKKVIGGAAVLCRTSGGSTRLIGNFANCSSAVAYCIGVHQGTAEYCW